MTPRGNGRAPMLFGQDSVTKQKADEKKNEKMSTVVTTLNATKARRTFRRAVELTRSRRGTQSVSRRWINGLPHEFQLPVTPCSFGD